MTKEERSNEKLANTNFKDAVMAYRVRKGKVASQKEEEKKKSNKKKINLVGNKYGRLLVTEMKYDYMLNGHNRTVCLCECDCGNELIESASKLTHGRRTSCGCETKERREKKRRAEYIGKKYGRLEVIDVFAIDGKTKCTCLCECGNIITTGAGNLKGGNTKSCGCLRKETTSDRASKDWTGAISESGTKIIEPTNEKAGSHIKWKCECGICGKEFLAIPGEVMAGRVKSCGCLKETNIGKRVKDMTGQRFGKLVVDHMVYGEKIRNKKCSYCVCKCDCGEYINLEPYELTSGKRISCGCDAYERVGAKLRKDVTGNKYGRLTVKEVFWVNGKSRCICVCDCGNEIETSTSSVINGVTKSCGCYKKEITTLTNSKDWTGVVSPTGVKFIEKAYVGDQGLWVWKCICGICGEEMYAVPGAIMSEHKKSCGCLSRSYGEEHISRMLSELNINFIEQYSFDDCVYKKKLRFDFAVFDENDNLQFLIEYDGEQHTRPVDAFGGEEEFKQVQKRDAIKNEYCKNNGIDLLRIPYFYTTEQVNNTIINKIYKH